jgi:hypothetical protein
MAQCSWTGDVAVFFPRPAKPLTLNGVPCTKTTAAGTWLKAAGQARLKLIQGSKNSSSSSSSSSSQAALELTLQQHVLVSYQLGFSDAALTVLGSSITQIDNLLIISRGATQVSNMHTTTAQVICNG